MNSQPLVSIVIDNYNYALFLHQAIDSALNQTYPLIEVIVVDDGSTDDSWEIIQSYGDQIISLSQKNAGQPSAINYGLSKTNGDIICLLDSDDIFHETKVEKIVNAFNSHPEWVQLSHYCTPINSEGILLNRGVDRQLSHGNVKALLLKHGKYGLSRTSALSFRSSALKKVLPIPIPEEKRAAADSYLMATVPFFGDIGYLNEKLTFYRIHGSNKHAHNTNQLNVDYHLRQRELFVSYINQIAERHSLNKRCSLKDDADYYVFSLIKSRINGGAFIPSSYLRMLYLIIIESRALKRSLSDIIVRLVWSTLCIVNVDDAKDILALGLKDYLRIKFSSFTKKDLVSPVRK